MSEVRGVGAGRDVHRIVTGRWQQNCYVVSCSGDAVIVDPGSEPDRIAAHVAAHALRPLAIINTHAHYDHVGAVARVAELYGAPFHLHPGDVRLLRRANLYGLAFQDDAVRIPDVDVALADGDSLRFGAIAVKVVHTPGHTPGGVCLEIGGELFTGDTVGTSRIGRSDPPDGDQEALETSVAKLGKLYPADTMLRPGHGEPAPLGDVFARISRSVGAAGTRRP